MSKVESPSSECVASRGCNHLQQFQLHHDQQMKLLTSLQGIRCAYLHTLGSLGNHFFEHHQVLPKVLRYFRLLLVLFLTRYLHVVA